ncbi:MAG: helix-turn-helix domain-containing protein [Coriobacteriia bacterium]|nr:helix-turn-helix domain-containing protein [Coriobacteriia bacterium]MCL2870792.1 helix-turn-helix domain-containing protein [Coriobacteriia bacterium]
MPSSQSQEYPSVMTVQEVADTLQITPQTVRALLTQKTLRGLKVGKFWRVPSANLVDYLKGGD